MADPAFVAELKHGLRFNPRQTIEHGDGIFSACSGNPILPSWPGPRLFDVAVTAAVENETLARQIDSSGRIAIFVGERADTEHWINVRQACQQFALQATALDMKVAFVNQPVEIAQLRPELANLAGVSGRRPDIVMRFGFGPAQPYSYD
jgi:hypothetical protein